MSPPLARPFPRFISDSAQDSRPYGRWEERLGEAFAAACGDLAGDAGTTLDAEATRFFPERTWGGRTYVPAVGRGHDEVDGVVPEFFGHVSFKRDDAEEPTDMAAVADFTDVTADDNPDWEVDLNDDVVGDWRADGGRGGEVTLIWGTPLVRGALAVTAELDGEVLDQAGRQRRPLHADGRRRRPRFRRRPVPRDQALEPQAAGDRLGEPLRRRRRRG